eukprot:4670972-Prymnesium_polylepis.1
MDDELEGVWRGWVKEHDGQVHVDYQKLVAEWWKLAEDRATETPKCFLRTCLLYTSPSPRDAHES